MPRNTQRSRASRAGAALVRSLHNRTFEDLDSLARFAENVATSEEVTSMIRRAGLNERMHLLIADGRGRKTYTLGPADRPGYWELSMPRGARGAAQVCIVMPWLIAERIPDMVHDGPAVVGMRLRLVERFLGSAAATTYRRALADHEVSRFSDIRFPGGGTGAVVSVRLREYATRTRTRAARARRSRGATRTRPRDSQRQRLYDAERTIFKADGGRRFASIAEVRDYVRNLESSPLWRTLAGQVGLDRWVVVKDGRGSRKWRASGRTIHIVRGHRFELVVLHELAHLVTSRSYAGHGPEFARNYLTLVEAFRGSEVAAKLGKEFARHGVAVAAPAGADELAA